MSDKYDELHPSWLYEDGIARICYKLVSIIRDDEGQEIGCEEGSPVTIQTMEAKFDSNLALAKAEAWLGNVTVERVPKEERPSTEPTQLDRVEAQTTYTAMMTDTLLEV